MRSKRLFFELFAYTHRTVLDPFLWFDFAYQGLVARRDLLIRAGGYDPTMRTGEDIDLILRVLDLVTVNQVSYSPVLGYEYRDNPGGVSISYWGEVGRNYERSLLAAAKRRSAAFRSCEYAGTRVLEGVEIDAYGYVNGKGHSTSHPLLEASPWVYASRK